MDASLKDYFLYYIILYHHVKERNARSIKIELIGDGLASRDNFDDRKKTQTYQRRKVDLPNTFSKLCSLST